MSTRVHASVTAALLLALSGCVTGGGGGGGDGGGGQNAGDADGGLVAEGPGGSGGEDEGPVPPSRGGMPITQATEAEMRRLCEQGVQFANRISDRQLCTLFVVAAAEAQAADPDFEGEAIDAGACTQAVNECTNSGALDREQLDCAEADYADLGALPERCDQVTLPDFETCMRDAMGEFQRLAQQASCNRIGQLGIAALDNLELSALSPSCERVDRLCPEVFDDADETSVSEPAPRPEDE